MAAILCQETKIDHSHDCPPSSMCSGRGAVFSHRQEGLSEHQPGVCEGQPVQDETQRWPHIHRELYSRQRWQDRHHPHQYLRYKRAFFPSAQQVCLTQFVQSGPGSAFIWVFFFFCAGVSANNMETRKILFEICFIEKKLSKGNFILSHFNG